MAWPLYMDAEIKPHRSLSQRGFVILISVITTANVAAALVFLSMGASLVPIFLGLDVVAVVIAFLASDYSSYMTGEVVSVSSQHP